MKISTKRRRGQEKSTRETERNKIEQNKGEQEQESMLKVDTEHKSMYPNHVTKDLKVLFRHRPITKVIMNV